MEVSQHIVNVETRSSALFHSKPFRRQLLISSAVWNMYFMMGMCVGSPTVFIPQMRREENSTYIIDDETVSWLYSLYGISAIPWVLLLPITTRYVGPRYLFIIACFMIMLVFMLFYFSTSITTILLGQIMSGYSHACNITVNIIIISEYTSPKYRGMFLTLKSASFFWGIWVSNAIGTFFHWKYIAVLGMFCCCYTFTSFLWPESAYWLANRGRFDKCKGSHRWLHGSAEDSENALRNLIHKQMENLKTRAGQKRNSCRWIVFTSKEFFMPLFLITLIITQFHFSGKYVCSIYILDILKNITGSESTAYTGMLILDGVTILGVYSGCVLTKLLNRRTLYLGSSAIGVAFLFIISLYLYLVKMSMVEERRILSIVLLMCFTIAISCGPMIMTSSIYGEIIPSRYKVTLYTTVAILFQFYTTSLLKITPLIFQSMELHGMYLFYGIVSGICTFLLYLYLPETKDKTLQEIEEYFTGKKESKKCSYEEAETIVTHET